MRARTVSLLAALVTAGGCTASVGDQDDDDVAAPAAADAAAPADAAANATSSPSPDAAADVARSDGAPADPTTAVFDPDVLHQITLDVAAQDLQTLLTDRTKRIAGTLTFDGRTVANVTAHRKGLTTGSSTKPSLVIDLDDLVKNQKLLGLSKLVLNNAVQDPSFLNEHLAYEFFRMAGQAAPRTAHGLVSINGKAYGLYIVEEAIDKTYLARAFGAANKEGNLYEGSLHDFVVDQTQGKWPNDLTLKNELEEMRTRDDIIALANVVKSAPLADFERLVGQKLDLAAFITLFAADMILCTWDDYFYASNNYYLYDNPGDGRFVVMTHSPDWLFSPRASFPTSKPDPTLDPFVPLASLKAGVGPGQIASKLRQIPALEARLRAEVARLARQVWDTPRLQARMDRAAAAIHTNQRTDAKVLADIASFDKQLPVMRDVVAKRPAFIATLAAPM